MRHEPDARFVYRSEKETDCVSLFTGAALIGKRSKLFLSVFDELTENVSGKFRMRKGVRREDGFLYSRLSPRYKFED